MYVCILRMIPNICLILIVDMHFIASQRNKIFMCIYLQTNVKRIKIFALEIMAIHMKGFLVTA